jgi:hypothetical protein
MKKHIKNLDTLEKEIYRLQLKAKSLEEKFDDRLDHLRENYSSMLMNSLFRKNNTKETVTGAVAGSVLNNERLQNAFSRVADHLIDRAAEGIEGLVDKMLGRK